MIIFIVFGRQHLLIDLIFSYFRYSGSFPLKFCWIYSSHHAKDLEWSFLVGIFLSPSVSYQLPKFACVIIDQWLHRQRLAQAAWQWRYRCKNLTADWTDHKISILHLPCRPRNQSQSPTHYLSLSLYYSFLSCSLFHYWLSCDLRYDYSA